MNKELIAGQCESCGADYRFEANLDAPVICPTCLKESLNWDTVEYSQMAPFIVTITK
jgi:predicted Zn-ribbon and HTH transcriptional regulator